MGTIPSNRKVLISGASIAGPALALWLDRYGFEVTVVEKATGVRPGGQEVDFKGETHRTVLRRMGILDDVLSAQVPAGDGAIVDAAGRAIGRVPAAFSGGEINVPRGDLASLIYEQTTASCEYIFGDSIASLRDTGKEVEVEFVHAPDRSFDLVVGADGIHSNVRGLAFGPEADYVEHLGYLYALADLDVEGGDEMYNEPGRMAALGGGKAPVFFVFAGGALDPRASSLERDKQIVADAFKGAGWRVPEMVSGLPGANSFYLDSISRVEVDRYSSGRVVLVGDSAYGNALGGFGTGLAIVGAYVLAGELAVAGGDHEPAFANYESKFRDYAAVSRKVNAGRLLAPRTRLGIRARNATFSVAALFAPFMKLLDRFATDIELPAYGFTPSAPRRRIGIGS